VPLLNVTTPIPASSNPRPPASWPLNILYADDMPELRRLMRHMLALDGHTMEGVADGQAALARVTEAFASFNLIITDHHMPGVDGLELVWHVRKLPFAGKVVVFSSELSPEVNDRYRQLGVDLILAKPIFPSVFRQELRQLFGHGQPDHPLPAGAGQ